MSSPPAPLLCTPRCIGQGRRPCPPNRLAGKPHAVGALPGYNINKATWTRRASCSAISARESKRGQAARARLVLPSGDLREGSEPRRAPTPPLGRGELLGLGEERIQRAATLRPH